MIPLLWKPANKERYSPHAIFAMRVAAALLFLQHGAEKLFGFAGATRVPDLFTQRGLAGFLETIGPLLLIFGVFPRFVAFILCGEMAVAYFQAWAPRGLWPITAYGQSLMAVKKQSSFAFSTCGS